MHCEIVDKMNKQSLTSTLPHKIRAFTTLKFDYVLLFAAWNVNHGYTYDYLRATRHSQNHFMTNVEGIGTCIKLRPGYTCDFLLALVTPRLATQHPNTVLIQKTKAVPRLARYLQCLHHTAKRSV